MTVGDVATGLLLVGAKVALLWSMAIHGEARCPRRFWMVEPGVCQMVIPDQPGVGPRGGYVDLSPTPPSVGHRLRCVGRRVRQSGQAAWCE